MHSFQGIDLSAAPCKFFKTLLQVEQLAESRVIIKFNGIFGYRTKQLEIRKVSHGLNSIQFSYQQVNFGSQDFAHQEFSSCQKF